MMGGWKTERIWTCAKHREGERMRRTQLIALCVALYLGKGYLPEVALLSHHGILLQVSV